MNKNAVQCASSILLIRPANFGFNEETASSNSFQKCSNENNLSDVSKLALAEFNHFADTLLQNGIDTIIIDDTPLPIKPDAIFPNNWISTHSDGTIILYPMFANSRRQERRLDIIEMLKNQFDVSKIIDLSVWEDKEMFLEGTGSIVFDHKHKTAFACSSPRTNKQLFLELCEYLSYAPIFFSAFDDQQKEIYHCNVAMNISAHFAIVCLECIPSVEERNKVVDTLQKNDLEIIEISMEQMKSFAGNMLSVRDRNNNLFLVMSDTAFNSLHTAQKEKISLYAQILTANIPTIETLGGGSIRCMMTEIFLKSKG
jgi:hypothetical protein